MQKKLSVKEKQRKYRHTLKEKKIFKYLMDKYKLGCDQELADFIYSSPSAISQIRNDKIGLSPKLVLVIYDKTPLSIEQIRKMAKEDV